MRTLMVSREAPPPSASAQPRGMQQFGQRPAAAVALQTALAPFEFKTGKPHMSHRAQVRGTIQILTINAGDRLSLRPRLSLRLRLCSKLGYPKQSVTEYVRTGPIAIKRAPVS